MQALFENEAPAEGNESGISFHDVLIPFDMIGFQMIAFIERTRL